MKQALPSLISSWSQLIANQKYNSLHQKLWSGLQPFLLFLLLSNTAVFGQSACPSIAFTIEEFTPCCYRMNLDNSSECTPQLTILIDVGQFTNFSADVDNGFAVSLISPTELQLTHSSGIIPFGTSSPLEFCIEPGTTPLFTVLYEFDCGLGEGCFYEEALAGCSTQDTCLANFAYVINDDCGLVGFINLSSGLEPLTYLWNFGDSGSGAANTSTLQDPSHDFDPCIDYFVCLTVTAVDGCMNTACYFVSIAELEPPVITCPQGILVDCSNDTAPSFTGTASAVDNCDLEVDITYEDEEDGSFPCDYSITRVWTATDNCGNSSTCLQVIGIVDNVAPVIINCPANITVQGMIGGNGNCTANVTIISPTTTDNCDPTVNLTNSFTQTGNASGLYPMGTTTVTWSAVDECLNISTCSFTVTVVCPSTNCDLLFVSLDEVTSPNDSACCYTADFNHPGGTISEICVTSTTANWIFNTGSILNLGYTWTYQSPVRLCFSYPGGIPNGNLQDVLTFCLSNSQLPASPSQELLFEWYNGEDVVCADTLMTNCPPPAHNEPCVTLSNFEIECDPENDLEYCVYFDITNHSGSSAFGIILTGLPSGFSYANCTNCGITGSPYGTNGWLITWIANPLANNGTRNLCVKIISSTAILQTTNVCMNATLQLGNMCCSSTEDWCVELEPCCIPCDETTLIVNELDSCCYSIDIDYGCDFDFFHRVDFTILTSGVHFGYHGSSWNSCSFPNGNTPDYVCISEGMQPGLNSNVLTFCLNDIDRPSEVPQIVQVTFWTIGAFGQDSVACDTILEFNCDYKKDTCVFTTSESIRCIPDSMKYEITVTVQNLSTPNFGAHSLMVLAPGITPNPIPFNPAPLNYGDVQTITFCYTPTIWPDPTGQLLLIYNLKTITGDTCCNGNQNFIDTLLLPACDSCFCEGDGPAIPNLVNNGTFTQGDNFFTSGLAGPGVGNSCSCAAGTYCVDQNFTDKCSGWPSVTDHTGNPGGNFLIVDGSVNGPAILWQQQVPLVPCMEYCFSFWTASVYPHSLQDFDVEVTIHYSNGSTSMGLVNVVQSNSPWTHHSVLSVVPCNAVGPFNISIDQIAGGAFVDFGIDDICLTKSEIEIDTCCKDFEAFNNLVSQGFTVTQNGCQVTVCSKQFNDCHFFGMAPSFGDNTPVPAVQVPAKGCWTHTYTQSGTYNICATVFEDTCWSRVMCVTVDVVCDPTGCTCPMNSLVSNPSLEFGAAGKPDNNDQIGLATNWSASNNLANVTSIGDWYSTASPFFPGYYHDLPNQIYSVLPARNNCQKYAGFDLSTCEGIGTQFTPAMISGQTYTISFWWSPKEPITRPATFMAVVSGQGCNVNLSGGVCTHTCGGDFHIPVTMTSANVPGVWYQKTATGIVPNLSGGTGPFLINNISFMGSFNQVPVNNQYIYIDDLCAFASFPETCLCVDADNLSFIDSQGDLPTVPYNASPVTLTCDNSANAVFYFHGNVHCSADSCISDDFSWSISGPTGGPVLSGSQPFSNVFPVEDEAHFDVQVPYAGLLQNVVYTITIIYNCGGKACEFSSQFVIECEGCICGPLIDLTWRPTHGGPNMEINCGDSLTLGCLQPAALVSFTGNFSCVGNNCPPANIHWELWKSGSQILVDYGVFQANGAFTFSLPGAYFATPGVYDLYWFGECDGRICVGCQFTITSTGCPCKCDNFERLKLVNKRLGINQSLECNNSSAIPIQCPAPGQPYRITGKLNCDPASCKPSNLKWELKNGASVVASGNQAGPWFSVLLDHALLSGLTAGVYDLVLTGTCGTDTCICVQRLEFSGCTMSNPCPCETQSEKDAFFNAVTAGFSYTYDFQGDCAILIKAGVDNCDQVNWKIEGVSSGFLFTGNTQGSQTIRVVFPTNTLENYKVTMTVTRPGTSCSLTYCSYVNLNCLLTPGIVCDNNLVQNGGFNSNTWAGILGHGGNTEGWAARSGNPEIWDGDGCNDPFSISLVGNCSPNGIDIIDYPVFIDEAKDGYKFSACYWNSLEDLKPGTHLVIRLSDAPQETAMCTGECVEIARIPIDQTSGDEWRTISTSHLRQQVSGAKFLTLHLENDLAYDESDANSMIMLDNICFEQDDSTTVPTYDIIDVSKAVRLYPNPNSGQFILEFDEPVAQESQILVSNLTGQLVYEKKAILGIAKQTIELSELSSGMYFVQVLTNGQIVSTDRFVKQ